MWQDFCEIRGSITVRDGSSTPEGVGELWGYIRSGLILITNGEIPLVAFLLQIGSSCLLLYDIWMDYCKDLGIDVFVNKRIFIFLSKCYKWIYLNTRRQRDENSLQRIGTLRNAQLILRLIDHFVRYDDNLHSLSSKLTVELTHVDERNVILIKFKIYRQRYKSRRTFKFLSRILA